MRARYARQRLLPEVGDAGQERLSAAAVEITGDARAAEVARVYLERAGVRTGGGEALEVGVPRSPAGLEEAAAFLAGAFAATERIKQILGAGASGALPASLFDAEDA